MLSILLTLVVLTAVAGAGIRVGTMQSASFARPAFTHGFERMPQAMRENVQGNSNPHAILGSSQGRGFDDNRVNNRRDGGLSFLSPIFGLIRFVVLGLLLWVGYLFAKKSGWRLSRVQVSPAPAPLANETPSVEVEEKKESE
jgi:hypothetical protein